jgi:hypothetical protein
MGHVLNSFVTYVRWPETIAATALVIQTLILLLHWRILRGHGETMEQQAVTAKLIGHALEQHGRILADHTRIMDEQFKVQRKIEASIERSRAPISQPDSDSAIVRLSKG